MKRLTCEMCGSVNLIKQDGVFLCQSCGTKYSVEEAKKMMIEGTVDVSGSTITIDNSAFVEKYLANARRAYEKEDWEEVEKYYNMVEQNVTSNMEAVFFSAYGKTMLSLTDSDYYKRQQKFKVLINSISVINDYFEETSENKEETLTKITDSIVKMFSVNYVFNPQAGNSAGGKNWQNRMLIDVKEAFLTELKQISEKHTDQYIQNLISKVDSISFNTSGCYIATSIYGSYNCPQVWTLRRFRDYSLAKTWYGRIFITVYYTLSPTLVELFGNTKIFKKFFGGILDSFVSVLNKNGIDDTPYEDKKWI